MNIAIVGCGLIGQKRLNALGREHRLAAVADLNIDRAKALACQREGAVAYSDWREVVARPDVDAVLIATTNDSLASIALAAAENGKHILIEKPAARSAEELEPVIAAVEKAGVVAQVGFNHRYHPSLQKAREIVDSGELGPLMFIRGRYGHGGRIGYDREWRADSKLSGGGELLDQGSHLIDLSRWFLGDFSKVDGFAHTYFWDMAVDDNGFMMLRTESNQTAWLHASCTEWKNMFSFEIYGRDGKLMIDGLGGSYGTERIAYYKMLPQMGPPETTIWEYPGGDKSWAIEFEKFASAVRDGHQPEAGLKDAKAVLEIVSEIYQISDIVTEVY